jgi:Cu(I)/Ag(I) efflux system membrane protein CusA/SilA
VILGAAGLIAVTVPIYQRLGSEFMPPLDEGAILFMPTTVPGISLTEAQRVLQMQDRLLSQIPEVERVMGKVGRAESATDPAPLSMMETVVQLRPRAQWRKVPTWYSSWPEWVKPFCRHFGSDRISTEELIHKMNDALAIPGVSNAWTMPIKGRIDMLTTGIRTPVGIKIHGADLEVIEKIGNQVASVLQPLPGTRNVFAERPGDGYFLDFDLKRDQLTHYGLTVDDAQTAVANAIGGENVTTIVDGRARYPVNVRYMRDFRNELDQLGQVLVTTGSGQHISLAEIADIRLTTGPSMIRDEGGLLSGYVYVDLADSDIGGYVQTAQRLVRERVSLPAGYSLSWSGQYESMQRVRDRLQLVLPLTLLLIFLLLYANTKSVARTLLVLLAVPFSAVGAIWLLYLLGYHLSIGVWVGLIALLGVDAETGMFMLLYLDLSFTERKRQGRMRNLADLHAAVMDGAVRRIRPKVMTVAAMFMGIVPILWSTGAGSDVMKRIAAPLAGGIFTSFVLELVVHPALYAAWQWHSQVKRGRTLKLVESVPAEF